MRHVSTQGRRWAFMARQRIHADDGTLIIDRLRVVQTPWFGVYLHGLASPDPGRDPHDHPFPWVSLVLRGGYLERLWEWSSGGRNPIGPRIRRRWSVAGVKIDQAHRIEAVQAGTVTLVLVGPRVQEWGFWTPAGYCRWDVYPEAGLGPDPFDG